MSYPEYKDKGIEIHKIASYQWDLIGYATLPVLCDFFQEIAGNHASANGFGYPQMIKAGQMWVLTRLKVEVDRYPRWNEEIIVKTWVRNRDGYFSERDFLILDKNENRLGGGLSGWMLLDLKTGRPKTVDHIPLTIQMFPDEHAVIEPLKKIKTVDHSDRTITKTVEFQDIDVNMHVNNVKYTEWFLSAFPYEFRKNNQVTAYEINYSAEMKFGDVAEISVLDLGTNRYLCSAKNPETGKEICKAEMTWKAIR
jgi:medium-chain acyl-[acyl-carrier-protein] hydrolase